MASTSVTVKVAPKVGVGFTTIAGLIVTILQAAAAIYAGIKTNDTLAVTAGVGAITTALTTLGGRFAQAVALVRRAAPVLEAGAAGFDEPDNLPLSGDEADLVSDADEFASPPPDDDDAESDRSLPVQPSQSGLTTEA